MIRKLVNWLLRTLHIRCKQKKSALVSIMELLPVLYAMAAVVTMVKQLRIELPLRVRVWLKIKFFIRYARGIVVGY